jgi:uncharacterized delta-60 repeat protein
MGIQGIVVRYVVIGCALLLSACGGGGDGDDGGGNANAPPPPISGIGPAGGTVNGPNGSKVVIPPGALAVNTPIAITQIASSTTPLPAGLTRVGQMFALTPHGTTFAAPVTITVPFDPATVAAGSTPGLYKTNAQNQWAQVANATFGASTVSGQVTSFSDLTAGTEVPPLTRGAPVRAWSLRELRGDALTEVEVAADTQIGGGFDEQVDLGPAFFDSPIAFDDGTEVPPDGIASADIGSTADGNTYYVGAESPLGNARIAEDPIGGKSRLVQYQTFTKNAADASYHFTLTSAFVEVYDGNSVLGRGCSKERSPEVICDIIKAEIHLDVQAFTADPGKPQTIFYRAAGTAMINGSEGRWITQVATDSVSRVPLWDPLEEEEAGDSTDAAHFDLFFEDFNGPDGHVTVQLREPQTYFVNLSSIPVGGAFTVKVVAHATAYDRAAASVNNIGTEFETAAHAWLRDPATIGGTTVTTTGLTAIDTPQPLVDPVEVPVSPAPCVPGPGPDPEAGVLQFGAATFTVSEGDETPRVRITRTGGSSGAVTATVTTSDGSAVAGVNYTALNSTVFFADNDTAERFVEVPLIQNAVGGEPDRTVTLTLSQPGGCTAIGARASTVLTIRDDDPAPAQPSGLDLTFDTDGKVTTQFGGDDTGMAIQSDGKIVIVGGSISDFVLARYNTNGSLDPTFGTNGLVTHSMLSGSSEEIARAVAIQPDGKIVVAGHTGQFGRPGRPANNRFDHAVVRYNANGSVDTTFGNGGVASSLVGRIFAMALQPDGGIIVVGDAPAPEDMMVARYNDKGNLDLTFGEGGFKQFDFDFGLGAELAESVAVQSNGTIVVSGPHTKGGETVREQHTAVVRLDAGGDPDASFGTAGVLLMLNARVGDGLAVQSDGRIVLVGDIDSATPNTPKFSTMRLNANGTPDSSFGTDGRVVTAVTTKGDQAKAVALQADGKIVVAGRSNNQANPNFAAVRYNADGTLDASFATAGIQTVDFFGFTDIAENVAIQRDGKIVLGGSARNNVDGYGLARVNP